MDPPPLRPLNTDQIPGGFETDEEPSPTKTIYDDARSFHTMHSRNASGATNSSGRGPFSDDTQLPHDDSSSLDEREMHARLMDVESSFLPENSPQTAVRHERDDRSDIHAQRLQSSQTPPAAYQTPAAYRQEEDDTDADKEAMNSAYTDNMSTSMLETLSSSPTAAAAARTVSRVVSMASMGGYETASEESGMQDDFDDEETTHPNQSTPKKHKQLGYENMPQEEATTPTAPESEAMRAPGSPDEDTTPLKSPRRRPQYLSSRYASQRSSRSSWTNTSVDEAATELTVGLQAGGGLPGPSSSRPDKPFSRTISLGSMASGISNLSDEDGRNRNTLDLDTLPEESSFATSKAGSRLSRADDNPQTPRQTQKDLTTPTDTVINQKVQDFEVPGTIARRFQDREGNRSPERMSAAGAPTPAPAKVKNLTLKEQSALIDKVQKENWKLKLKLYFMDQTLAERSDESVKAMISENVELKTLKFSMSKEIRGLKREVRQLEFKLKERDETIGTLRAEAKERDRTPAGYSEADPELETEVVYLRERMETYEVEIEKLRQENVTKEGEKRRLAEMVKKANDRPNPASDVGAREEVELWKDLLEAESARKEQADEECRALREEIWAMKAQQAGSQVSAARSQDLHSRPRSSHLRPGSVHVNGTSSASQTLVEQLRHENAELRREVGAQTSMLTSRNREKERLYLEIEDLKMGLRHGERRSDSILDRSVSRAHARSASRTSSQSRITALGDAEREAFETHNGELRDQIASLKLENQELARQLDGVLDELEQLGDVKGQFDELRQQHDELTARTDEELLAMQSERDEALTLHEEAELSFLDLKNEAQERINELENELDQQGEVIKQLETELTQRDKDSENLRNEVRMTAEGLARVESDVQTKVQKISELQHRVGELELQNEDLTQELESIEDSLNQANSKCEKLGVELESRVSECAFLREEQDATMLRIGDLENNLKATQASFSAEKDKTKDLETRLADERHQREVIGGQEKQEVQKIINELNRDASTSKDEARKLRKLVETRDAEIKTWKERLTELEGGLKEVLGDTGSGKSSYFSAITRIQRDLESTTTKLESTRHVLNEKERLLERRDQLLESHGLESRKLSELLEKERASRRAERLQQDQWQKSHQHTSRTVSQKDARITELESSRSSDRKRLANLENQYRDQLSERNALLLSMWSKLSALCGSDWQHQNNLVSGHLPTLDVVANMLPAFSKNLLHAVKAIESIVSGFRSRVKSIERDLNKDYQQLEHNLDLRIKRLDRLESAVQVSKISGAANAAPEIAKLRGENRLLKSELEGLRSAERVRVSRSTSYSVEQTVGSAKGSRPGSMLDGVTETRPASKDVAKLRNASLGLQRGYSAPIIDSSAGNGSGKGNEVVRRDEGGRQMVLPQEPVEPSNQRWIHRLRELERRLKAEREARLLDRSGAAKRLKEGMQENEELRAELERERERRKRFESN